MMYYFTQLLPFQTTDTINLVKKTIYNKTIYNYLQQVSKALVNLNLGVLKRFVNCTGKYQCCSPFLRKFQAYWPATLVKRDLSKRYFL